MSNNQPEQETDGAPKRPSLILMFLGTLVAPFHYLIVQIFGTIFELFQMEPGEGIFDHDKEDIVGRWVNRLAILVLTVAIGAGGYYGYKTWKTKKAEAAAARLKGEKKPLTGKAIERDKNSNLISDLERKNRDLVDVPLVSISDLHSRLERRIELANQIYDHPAADSDSEAAADEIMLESYATLVVSKHDREMEGTDELKELVEFSNRLSASDRPIVKARALLGLASANFIEFAKDQDSVKGDELKESLISAIHGFDECEPTFIARKAPSKTPWLELGDLFEWTLELNSTQSEKICVESALELKQCKNSKLREIGFKVYDMSVYRKFNFNYVYEGISYRGEERLKEAIEFVETASSDPNTSFDVFLQCVSIIERFSQFDLDELASRGIASLQKLPPLVADAELKLKLETEINNCSMRYKLVGETLDLDVVSLNGSPLLPAIANQEPVVVIFYSDSDRSKDAMTVANDVLMSLKSKFVVVGCSIVPELDKSSIRRRKNPLPNWFLVGYDDAAKIRKQCPVTTGPFILVLDSNHVVKQVNIHEEQIRKIVQGVLN